MCILHLQHGAGTSSPCSHCRTDVFKRLVDALPTQNASHIHSFRRSPVEEGSPTQQQLHHLGVAFFGRQVKRREALLVTFVQQTGVCHGLQQAVTCIDAAVP